MGWFGCDCYRLTGLVWSGLVVDCYRLTGPVWSGLVGYCYRLTVLVWGGLVHWLKLSFPTLSCSWCDVVKGVSLSGMCNSTLAVEVKDQRALDLVR